MASSGHASESLAAIPLPLGRHPKSSQVPGNCRFASDAKLKPNCLEPDLPTLLPQALHGAPDIIERDAEAAPAPRRRLFHM